MSYETNGIVTEDDIERALQQALAAILGLPLDDDPESGDLGDDVTI
jgi:hypothetical protein